MKYIFTTLFAALLFTGYGQMLEDETRVLNKVQGEAMFSLNAGEYVFSFAPDNGWYKIRKEVYIDPVQVVDNKYIINGTTLKNKDGEAIGMTLDQVKVVEGVKEEGFRSKDRYRAIIEGYVFKTKFRDKSRPEERITELLAEKSRSEQSLGFQDLFKTYSFEKRNFDELTAYVYREENKTLKPEKDFRVIVVFRGESSPYAVITNEQEVASPKIKASWEDNSYRVIYFYKPTPAQEELVQDRILYTFIAL